MDEKFRYKWVALIGISLLAFTAFLDFTIVNTALPFIQKDLNTNVLELQWVANIFAIVLSMSMIAVGKFGDRWGRKKIFYVGVVIFGIAAFGAGHSPSIDWLTFFRALQGLGASIVYICAAALLSDAFPKDEQARAVGIYSGITGIGLMVGPFLGGMLISALNWRWVFWINLPLIFFGLIFCIISLKHIVPPMTRVKIDWLSLFLLVFGLGVLIYGIIAMSGYCLIGLAALILLLVLDFRKPNPLLSLKPIFHNRLILLSLLSCCMGGIVSYVFMFFDPLYLENVRKDSPFTIGLIVAIIPAAQVIISFTFNHLLKWLGMANLFLFSIFMGALAAGLHWTIGAQTPILWILVPLLLLGIPWGLSNAGMVTAVNQTIESGKIGETIGTIATAWNVTGAIFLSISTVIFHKTGPSFMPAFYSVTQFNFLFTLLVLAAAIWIRLKLKKHPGRF